MSLSSNLIYPSVNSTFYNNSVTLLSDNCTTWFPSLIFSSIAIELIKKAIEICPKFLSKHYSSFRLTPVHLATIRNDHSVLEALHQAGAEIDRPDAMGYTPLHHMAMKGDLAGVSTLLSWGANPETHNKMGGTYADLLRFNEPFRPAANTSYNSSYFSAHKHDKLEIDPNCIPGGVKFINEVVAKPEELIIMWEKTALEKLEKSDTKSVSKSLKRKYNEFKESPPKVAVKPITTDDAGNLLNMGSSFCGLVAQQFIKKGSVIAEYVGEVFGNPVVSYGDQSAYLWKEWPAVDGKTYRSGASLINHGFPNAEMKSEFRVTELGADGLPYRKIITAIDNIEPGQQIILNYGPFYDWEITPKELRPMAVCKFIKENSWENLLMSISEAFAAQKLPADTGLITQTLSVLISASHLIMLVNEGLMNLDDFERISNLIKMLNLKIDLEDVRNALMTKFPDHTDL